MFFGKIQKKIMNNVIEHPISIQENAKFHRCPKNLKFWKILLSKIISPPANIFDPFLGSGTSRIACYELGFDFIGCEFDKDYWEAQEKRFMEFKKKFHNEFYIGEADLFKGLDNPS